MAPLIFRQIVHLASLDALAAEKAVQPGFIAWIDGYGRYTAAPVGTFAVVDGLHVVSGQDNVEWGDDTNFLSSPNISFPSTTTTNNVPALLYSKTLDAGSIISIHATIIAIRSTGSIVGKFSREFTIKRDGSNPADLLQDLVTSPDYTEDPNLSVSDSVSGPNAVIMVAGLSGTVDWHGHIEITS